MKMKTRSRTLTRKMICLAVTCLVVGVATSALAVPPNELLKVEVVQFINGQCCQSFNESVTIREPAKLSPVVVNWTTEFINTQFESSIVGLSVNDGSCSFIFGPLNISESAQDTRGFFQTLSWQWIINPGDIGSFQLHPGTNTISLCGGGPETTSQLELGNNTLFVRIAK